MNLKNLGELNKLYNFQDTKIFVRYLNKDLITFKKCLILIPKNVILPVFLAVMFTMTKVNV